MAKYLLLKHYRGGPERSPQGCIPMDQWTPQEISDHIGFMQHVADTLRERGEPALTEFKYRILHMHHKAHFLDGFETADRRLQH
mgnify:CR=1 FL=1